MNITNIIERAPSPSRGTLLTGTSQNRSRPQPTGQHRESLAPILSPLWRNESIERPDTSHPNRETNPKKLQPTSYEPSQQSTFCEDLPRSIGLLGTFARLLAATQRCAPASVPAYLVPAEIPSAERLSECSDKLQKPVGSAGPLLVF